MEPNQTKLEQKILKLTWQSSWWAMSTQGKVKGPKPTQTKPPLNKNSEAYLAKSLVGHWWMEGAQPGSPGEGPGPQPDFHCSRDVQMLNLV